MKLQFSRIQTLLLVIILLSCRLGVFAQQSHFIYIQSDNKQPFFVLFNKKSYNSSSTGYVIISKVPEGKQELTLGFTNSAQPAFDFPLTIDADAGFALKDYNEKGWGLYNLQTMAVIMGAASLKSAPKPQPKQETAKAETPAVAATQPATAAPVATPAQPKAANQFGDMLSQVVDDPDLAKIDNPKPAEKPAVKTEKAPAKTGTAVAKGTKPATAKTTATKPAVTAPVVDSAAAEDDVYGNAATRGVIKAAENQDEKGTAMTFIDFNNKGSDTVKIYIPEGATADSSKPAAAKEAVATNDTPAASEQDTAVVAKDSAGVSNPFYTKPAGESKTAAAETKTPVETKAVAETQTTPDSKATTTITATKDTATVAGSELPEKKIASYNSNCTGGMASDKDLDKLRKRMVGEGADDKMIAVAKKAFKIKCYTTDQIRTLGMLFYTDESRYSFYDASYPFVYDVTNFSSLEKMLLDDYYKKRFRAMLRM